VVAAVFFIGFFKQIEMADYRLRIIVNGEDRASKTFKDIGSSLDDFGDKVKGIGAGLSVGLTAPLVALGAAAFKAGTDLNAGLANIASLGIAESRVLELKTSIQDMAIEFGQSTNDMVDGAYQIISTFGDTADTALYLEISTKAAAAGLATVTDAILLGGAVTKAYGDTSAKAYSHVQDLAFQTVNLGVTTFPELAAAMGKVVPLTAALGVSMEDTFAVMATATGVTGNTAEVTTQLRGIMQALMDPTKATTELFKAMGIESGKAAIKQLGLQGSIELLTSAAEATGLPLSEFIGSIEGQTLAMQLAGGSQEQFTKNLAAMQNVAGATDAAFKAQTTGVNALGFQFQQAKAKLQVFLQTISDAMGPALLTFANAVTPLGDKIQALAVKFAAMDPATQKWIVGLAAGAAALGPVLVGVGMALPALAAMGKAIGVLSVALGALGAPLAIVAAGIAAAFVFDIGGIRTKFNEVVTWVQSRIPAAITTLQGLWEAGWAALPAALTAASAIITPAVAGIKTVLGQLGTFFAPVIARLVSGFSSFVTQISGLGDHFAGLRTAMSALSVAAAPILQALGVYAEVFGMAIGAALGVTALTAINALSAVFKNLGTIVKAAISQATLIINTLATVIGSTLTGVKALIEGDWATAWTSAKTIFKAFAALFTGSINNLSSVVSSVFGIIGTTISTTLADLGFTAMAAQIQTVIGKIQSLITWLGSIPASIPNPLANFNAPPTPPAAGEGTYLPPAFYEAANQSTGTPSFGGGWTWVGERGPELLNLPRGAQVMSNQQSMGMIGQLAGGTGGLTAGQQAGFNAFVAAQGQKEADKAAKELKKSVDKMGKTIDKSIDDMAQKLGSILQSIPGLFGTSSVTADQMKMGALGVPQNFADDYLRRLTDEVVNGVDWANVDITDAAARAGIDPSLPHEAILEMFKAAWGDSSLFANAANLDLINQEAVQAGIDKANAQAAGKANIMALFGIAPDEAAAQAVTLGTSLHTGIQQGITQGNATGTGLGTSLVAGMASDITPESMAPVASAIATGLTTGLDGEDVSFGTALESVINKQLEGEGLFAGTAGMILEKIAGYFTDQEFGVDLVGNFASIWVNQLGVQSAIDHLLDVGGRIAEIVFKGYQAKSEELDWTGAVTAASLAQTTAATTATDTTTTLPNDIIGRGFMGGVRQAATNAATTIINVYATVNNEMDINKLAYQVAAVQQRRR
jgi:TP901 family phage tail tape measure protein